MCRFRGSEFAAGQVCWGGGWYVPWVLLKTGVPDRRIWDISVARGVTPKGFKWYICL